MEKNTKYLLSIIAITVIIVSAFLTIELNSLQNTVNNQSGQLNQYNQVLNDQAGQLNSLNQTITSQNAILNQYNHTITAQNQTITEQSSQLDQYNQTIAEQNATISNQNDELSKDKTVTVVDDFGYIVNITSTPKRIVSLSPSNTEILFAVGAGGQVVGVTKYCDYPYNFSAWVAAGNISSIGSYWQPAIEPVIALNPDLVVASGSSSEGAATKLRNLGYTVIILNAENLNGVLNDLYLVGKATGHADQATALVSSYRARIDTITAKVANASSTPKVYYETYMDPLMSAGPNTFVSDLFAIAGGKNIYDDAAAQWPTISSDSVITKNPDIIISYHSDGFSTRPGWSTINAVANNKIYAMPNSIFSRPGPRLLDALDSLTKIIHPEIFGAYA